MGTILQEHQKTEFSIKEFSPKMTKTKEQEQIDKLENESIKLTLELENSNRRLGQEIRDAKAEIHSLRYTALIATSALGTGTIILLILITVALCCLCHTWSKINFYHR